MAVLTASACKAANTTVAAPLASLRAFQRVQGVDDFTRGRDIDVKTNCGRIRAPRVILVLTSNVLVYVLIDPQKG